MWSGLSLMDSTEAVAWAARIFRRTCVAGERGAASPKAAGEVVARVAA